MFARRKKSLPADASAVTEILSYLFGFLISVLILGTSLVAFSIVANNARALNMNAEMTDLANRIGLGVQEAVAVGVQRAESVQDIPTQVAYFQRVLTVPIFIQNEAYNVTLDEENITISASASEVEVRVPTFNVQALLPQPPASCASRYAICELYGVTDGGAKGPVDSGSGQIKIAYEYNAGPPIVNRVVLS